MAREKPTKHWHGGSLIAWIAIVFTVVVNLAHLSYTTGTVTTRLKQVEDSLIQVHSDIRAQNALNVKVYTLETELRGIHATLQRLEHAINKTTSN
jgi:hypothetical protein